MRHRVYALLCLLSCGLLLSMPSAAADDLPEYRLKAAILYNFAAFTEWPNDVGTTLNLCIYGQDPFGGEIDQLQGRTVGGRTIAVHRIGINEALTGCQLVYIANSAVGNLKSVLDSLRGTAVLTVADTAGAARRGVVFNMAVVQNRVVFEANLEAAHQARLNLSSKLLRLANEVLQ